MQQLFNADILGVNPNRQPTLYIHHLSLEVLTVYCNELRLFYVAYLMRYVLSHGRRYHNIIHAIYKSKFNVLLLVILYYSSMLFFLLYFTTDYYSFPFFTVLQFNVLFLVKLSNNLMISSFLHCITI